MTGKKVFTFAPSAEASRGVLRSDAGFANAETVEALLLNEKLQAQVRGQVIWIDEAGLLSIRTLARVADFAENKTVGLFFPAIRRNIAPSSAAMRCAFWKSTPIFKLPN